MSALVFLAAVLILGAVIAIAADDRMDGRPVNAPTHVLYGGRCVPIDHLPQLLHPSNAAMCRDERGQVAPGAVSSATTAPPQTATPASMPGT